MGKNDKRIQELEEQIKQLTQQLELLIQEKERENYTSTQSLSDNLQKSEGTHSKGTPETPLENALCVGEDALFNRIKGRLKIGSQDELERKIGSIWASRLGAILVMTAVVLGTRATFYSTGIGLTAKICLGYLFSLLLILGERLLRYNNIFSEVILSCGLAGIYFTTYAGLFLGDSYLMHLFHENYLSLMIGFPILLLCLLPLIIVAHKRKSSTIAGIGLFLTYYTVALSCYNEPNIKTLSYALITSVSIACITFIFHLVHQWFFLSWTGVIASYITYIYVFLYLNPHTYFHIPEKTYFWISFLFLTTCFILFSTTCILEARKRGEYRKGIAPLVGLNSAIYFTLTFYAIRTYYLPYEYLFRIGFTLLLFTFTLVAHFTGPKNNYLFKVFLIKTVIMTTLALQSYFSGEKLLIALSIECLALSLAHKRSGYFIYRILNFFLLWVTLIWGVSYIKTAGNILIMGYLVPANWFAILGTSCFLLINAWFYEHFIPLESPYIEQGYEIHFSSLTWRFSPLLMSVLHACIASFLILLLTIADFIDDFRLPLILTTELLVLLGMGLLTSTPAIEFSAVLLLVSAQVCFLFYFFTNPQSLFELPFFLSMSLPLGFISYIGAYAWEKYLNKIHPKQDDNFHFILSILPYLSSVLITLIVIHYLTPFSLFPVVISVLGFIIYYICGFLQLPSFSISGITLILSSVVYYLIYLSSLPEEKPFPSLFFVSLFLSAMLFLTDRILSRGQKALSYKNLTDTLIRILLIGGGIIIQLSYSFVTLPKNVIIFYWLGTGMVIICIGMLLQESLYRWSGFGVLSVTLLRIFFVFQYISSEIYQVLSFAVSALVLFLVGWLYSRNQTIEK